MKRWQIVLLSAALTAISLLPVSAAGAAPSWLDSQQISWSFGDTGDPQISVGGAGSAVAAWTYHDGATTRIQSSSRPAGGQWGMNFLSMQGYEASNPRIATNLAGDAAMVWQMKIKSGDETKHVIRASRKKANGGWGTPETISYSNESTINPDIAIDGYGRAIAVWEQEEPFVIPASDGKIIRSATMTSDGTWAGLQTVEASAWISEPQVGIGHFGDAVVIWHDNDSPTSNGSVRSATKPAGQSWSAVDTVSGSGGAEVSSHQLAVNTSGKVDVVWSTGGKILARSKQIGGGWGGISSLSNSDAGSNPQIGAGPSGKSVAAWLQDDSNGKKRATAAVKAAGGSWGTPATLSDSGMSVSQVQAVVSGTGIPTVVWQQPDGNDMRIVATRREEESSLWWQPKPISSAATDAESPTLSADSYGNVAAVWRQTTGEAGKKVVHSTVFDATGPYKLNVDVPVSGTVGEELKFSVNPLDLWSPILKVVWKPEFGVEKTGETVTHVYKKAGTYSVNVVAYDASYNGTGATRNIKIEAKDDTSGGDGGEEPGGSEPGGEVPGGDDPGGVGPGGDDPAGDGSNPGGDGPGGPLQGADDGKSSNPAVGPKPGNPINKPVANLEDVLGKQVVGSLSGDDFKAACNFRITSPKVGTAKYGTVRISKKRKGPKRSTYVLRLKPGKVKRIISGHGVKGTVRPGRVKGTKVVCSNLQMALLHKRGRHFSPPGLTGKRYRVSARRFNSKSFARRVVKRLKGRFGIGRLRTKIAAGGALKVSFKNYSAKAKQRISREASRRIQKVGLKGNTYYLKYSVEISGVTVAKQLKILAER